MTRLQHRSSRAAALSAAAVILTILASVLAESNLRGSSRRRRAATKDVLTSRVSLDWESTVRTRRTKLINGGGDVSDKAAARASASGKKPSSPSSQNATKPTLVLHVGPFKTGSTFLQCVLGGLDPATSRPIMLKDNFVHVGISSCGERDPFIERVNIHAGFWSRELYSSAFIRKYPTIPDFDDVTPRILNPAFLPRLDELHAQGRNAMFVEEYLSISTPSQIQYLAERLKPKWHVRIVLHDRPLFSLLASGANQMAKNINGPGLAWPGQPLSHYNLPFDLEDVHTAGHQRFVAHKRHGKSHAQLIKERFQVHFDDIHIIPLHRVPSEWGTRGANPLLDYLMCRALQDLTPHSCQHVTDNTFVSSTDWLDLKANPSAPLNYRFLADAAYKRGWIPATANRMTVVDLIREEQEVKRELTIRDFPIKCMPKRVMDELFNVTLQTERNLFHDWSDEDTESLRADFQEHLVAKQRHCHADVEQILDEDKEWQAFFREKFAPDSKHALAMKDSRLSAVAEVNHP